jgi:hypothetical protein
MSERILIHFSPEPIKKFLNKPIIRKLKNDKPEGLWYSYNDIWLQFCKLNPSRTGNIDNKWVYFFSLKNDIFTTNIDNTSTNKILVINRDNYKEFIEKYMLSPNINYNNEIPIYNKYTKWTAFWNNVKNDWGGVEFSDNSLFNIEYIVLPDIKGSFWSKSFNSSISTDLTLSSNKKQYLKLKINKLFKYLDILSGCIFNPLTFNGGLSLDKKEDKIFVKSAQITNCNLSKLLSKLYTNEDLYKYSDGTIKNSPPSLVESKSDSNDYEDILLKTLSSDEYNMGDLQLRLFEKMEEEELKKLEKRKKIKNRRLLSVGELRLNRLNKSLKKYMKNKKKFGLSYRTTKKKIKSIN